MASEADPSGPGERARTLARSVRLGLRKVWAGRSVCLVAQSFDAYFDLVIEDLKRAGAEVRCVIAAHADPAWIAHAGLPVFDIGPPEAGWEDRLRDSQGALVQWLDALDPRRAMLVLGSQFMETAEVAGRRVVGWRRQDWGAWEDKTVTPDRLRALGLATPDGVDARSERRGAEVILSRAGAVVVASGGLDRGGASMLRVACSADQLSARLNDLADSPARASAFTRGTSFSVIGMVWAGEVIAFDPIEIVVLLDTVEGRFVFCGSSSLWRPPEDVVQGLRDVALTVGQAMATEGFRGGFSIDGVMGPDGMVVTEVNARNATGLRLRYIWPSFPAYLFARTAVEPWPSGAPVDAAELQACVRGLTRAKPSFSVLVPKAPGAPANGRCRFGAGPTYVDVRFGPSPKGLGVRLLEVEGLDGERRLGPCAAALAAHIGVAHLVYPDDAPLGAVQP